MLLLSLLFFSLYFFVLKLFLFFILKFNELIIEIRTVEVVEVVAVSSKGR